MPICECGCNQTCKNRFIYGHRIRTYNPASARKGKTWEEIFGSEKALEMKKAKQQDCTFNRPEIRARSIAANKSRPPHLIIKKGETWESRYGSEVAAQMRRKLSKSKMGHEVTKEVRKRISEANLGKKLSEERKQQMREYLASEWRKGRRKLNFARPNKLEGELQELINEVCPGEYKYNDGWLILDYKVPDFVSVNKKNLIEMNGEPWHKDTERDRERIEIFSKLGYRTLIIWCKELLDKANRENLRRKIIEFNGRQD